MGVTYNPGEGYTLMENGEMRAVPNPLGVTSVCVVMINNRHDDPKPYVFTDPGRAVEFAKKTAREMASHGAAGQCEVDERPVAGFLYHATFCAEGDDLWVVERRVDDPEDD